MAPCGRPTSRRARSGASTRAGSDHSHDRRRVRRDRGGLRRWRGLGHELRARRDRPRRCPNEHGDCEDSAGGTPPSVAATDETAWVTIAGARGERPSLPPPAAPSRRARRVRTSSSRPITPSGRGPLTRHQPMRSASSWKHGLPRRRHTVGYQSCDNSTAQTGASTHQVRLEREGVCSDRSRGRSDRPLQLGLRGGPDTGHESGRGAARHDQPLEHP